MKKYWIEFSIRFLNEMILSHKTTFSETVVTNWYNYFKIYFFISLRSCCFLFKEMKRFLIQTKISPHPPPPSERYRMWCAPFPGAPQKCALRLAWDLCPVTPSCTCLRATWLSLRVMCMSLVHFYTFLVSAFEPINFPPNTASPVLCQRRRVVFSLPSAESF